MNAPARTPPLHWALGAALWLLFSTYALQNLLPLQLMVDVSAPPPDTARVYWSTDGESGDAHVLTHPLANGWNRLIFPFALGAFADHVLLAPGERASGYRIHAVRWQRAGLFADVPVYRLALEPHFGEAPAGDRLLAGRFEAPPRIVIPAPSAAFLVTTLGVTAALPVLGLLLLAALARRRASDLVRYAGALLAGGMLCCAYVVLRIGPALPLYDDWRYLFDGPCNLVDGGWAWTACVSNDTYYLTNQLLDALVLRASNVDFSWLRAIALALLALQIALQFRVLRKAASPSPAAPAIVAVGAALLLLPLTAGAYWGTTALGYQQALPTLSATLCLNLLIGSDGRLRSVSTGVLLLLAAAAGLAYISGGPLIASLGIALLLARSADGQPATRAGWFLLLSGVALLVVQLGLVIHHQGSLLQHGDAGRSVWPNDRRFWIFFVGLFGRALCYHGTSLAIDAALTLLVLLPGTLLAALCLIDRRADLIRAWSVLGIFAAAGAASYAAMVAFGRGGFIGADAGAAAISAFAKSRFHYWPVAALVPYAWIGWVALAALWPRARTAVVVLAGLALAVPKSVSLFDQKPALYVSDYMQTAGIDCVSRHADAIDAGLPLACPVMTGAAIDMTPALRRLRARGSPTYDRLVQPAVLKERRYPEGFAQ